MQTIAQPSNSPQEPDEKLHVCDFKTLVEALFSTQSEVGEVLSITTKLSKLFMQLTSLDDCELQTVDSVHTDTTAGTAISAIDAARCLLDFKRTSHFVQGLDAAIIAAQKNFPGQTIEVLYAGCGPFATLALPLCTRYSPNQLQFTLLDIHQHTLDYAARLIHQLGFAEYIRAYVTADATQYQHPATSPTPHIVISETMQKTLQKEPQLAITANLAPQMHDQGFFIPEQININMCLADLNKEFDLQQNTPERVRLDKQRVLELNAATIQALMQLAQPDESKQTECIPLGRFQIPKIQYETPLHLMLQTEIIIFGDILLQDYDTGISLPTIVHEFGHVNGGEIIQFSYQLGKNPGIRQCLL